jgi:hypothetical protein
VFSREIKGKVFTFGVSGLLYKSNVLMYDRRTESLWSQLKREAVAGPMTGTPLKVLPSNLATWEKWKKRYPGTEVLSTDTGYARDYSRDPYEEYYKSKKGLFSFLKPGIGEEEKQLVVGVALDKFVKAYPLDHLRKKGSLTDRVEGKNITIVFDPRTDEVTVKDSEGNKIPYIIAYWFVWKGIHSSSELFRLRQ